MATATCSWKRRTKPNMNRNTSITAEVLTDALNTVARQIPWDNFRTDHPLQAQTFQELTEAISSIEAALTSVSQELKGGLYAVADALDHIARAIEATTDRHRPE
jgi:hypothetical protein